MVDQALHTSKTRLLLRDFEERESYLDFHIDLNSFYFSEQFLEDLEQSIQNFRTTQGLTTLLRLNSLGVYENVDKSEFRQLMNAFIRKINEANTFVQFDENQLFFEGDYFTAEDKDIEYHDEQGLKLYERLITEFKNIRKRLEEGETAEEIAETPQASEKKALDEDDKEKLARAISGVKTKTSTPTAQEGGEAVQPTSVTDQTPPLTPEQINVEENIRRSQQTLLMQETARETVILENLILNTYDLSALGITHLSPALSEIIRAKVGEAFLDLDITKFIKEDGTLDRTKLVTLRAKIIRSALPTILRDPTFQVGLSETLITGRNEAQLTEAEKQAFNKLLSNTEINEAIAKAVFHDGTVVAAISLEIVSNLGHSPNDANELARALPKEYQELYNLLDSREQAGVFGRINKNSLKILASIQRRTTTQPGEQPSAPSTRLTQTLGVGGIYTGGQEEGIEETEVSYSDSQKKNFEGEVRQIAYLSQLTSQQTINEVVSILSTIPNVEKKLDDPFFWDAMPDHIKGLLSGLSPANRQRVTKSYAHELEKTSKNIFARFNRQVQQLTGSGGKISLEDIEQTLGKVDWSKLDLGNQPLTVDLLLRSNVLSRDLEAYIKNNPRAANELTFLLRKVDAAERGGFGEAENIQLTKIAKNRQAVEANLRQILRSRGIDGTDQEVIIRLLQALALSGDAQVPYLLQHIDTLVKISSPQLQTNIQTIQKQIRDEERKLSILRNQQKIQDLKKEEARNHTLNNNLVAFSAILSSDKLVQELSEEFTRLSNQERIFSLQSIFTADVEELANEEFAASIWENKQLIDTERYEIVQQAIWGGKLDPEYQYAKEVENYRSALLSALSEEEQRILSYNDFVQNGFSEQLPDFGQGGGSAISKLNSWRDRINKLKSLKAKAVKKLAEKLGKEGLKKLVMAAAPALGVGAAAGLIAKLLGATAQVAAGAGIGGFLGGVAGGFLIGGPAGAVVGGFVGALAGGGITALSQTTAGTEGLVAAKDFAGNLTSSAMNGARNVATSFAEGATQTITASTVSPTLGVPVAAVVGGTIVGVGALGAFSLMTILGAFLPDANNQFVGTEEFSRFVDIRKTASPTAINNDEQRTIAYTITITPKSGYTITPTDIRDEFSYLGGDPLTLPNQTQTILNVEDGPKIGQSFSEPIRFSYEVPMSGVDVLVTNRFTLAFTASKEGENTEQDELTRSASVRIGNPKVGCFEFGEAGYLFPGDGAVRSITWQPDEQEKILRAFARRAGTNADFVSLLCNRSTNITVYRLPGRNYGGWAPGSPNAPHARGDVIGIYDLGIGGTDSNTEYTLIHEMGHILDYRNGNLRSQFNQSKTTSSCFTYPYGCSEAEAFAEGLVLYVVYTDKVFSRNNSTYNFKGQWPTEFNWFKENVFGGFECDTNTCQN